MVRWIYIRVNTVDFNIEFCHIYAGIKHRLNNKDKENIHRTKILTNALQHQEKNYCLCVLVDDYSNPSDFEEKAILNLFENEEIKPNYIVKESSLSDLAERFIKTIPKKWKKMIGNKLHFVNYTTDFQIKNEPQRYESDDYLLSFLKDRDIIKPIKNNNSPGLYDTYSDIQLWEKIDDKTKYSCTLLTACWHLLRLGVPSFKDLIKKIYTIDGSNKPFFGKRIITVLPLKYINIEANAMELLSFSTNKQIKKSRQNIEYIFH